MESVTQNFMIKSGLIATLMSTFKNSDDMLLPAIEKKNFDGHLKDNALSSLYTSVWATPTILKSVKKIFSKHKFDQFKIIHSSHFFQKHFN